MTVLDRFRLDDKSAIVTGGNRGIGRALSQALAEAGADVVVANRDTESGTQAAAEIEEETGVDTRHITVDVSDEAAVAEMVSQTVEAFGSVDVLFNNAGIVRHVPAEELTEEDWDDVVDVNLKGAFLCAKHAARNMIEHDGGSIVNTSSLSAFMGNYPQKQASYNASKAGMEGLKLQLASEWAEYGIRVNNIVPGYIKTDIAAQAMEKQPERAEIWKSEMLFDEMAPPEDLGPLAVYLASDASNYMTGSSIKIDGGYLVR